MQFIFPPSVAIIVMSDFTDTLLGLGDCLYMHNGGLQNKCFPAFILLYDFHLLMSYLLVETIDWLYKWNIYRHL